MVKSHSFAQEERKNLQEEWKSHIKSHHLGGRCAWYSNGHQCQETVLARLHAHHVFGPAFYKLGSVRYAKKAARRRRYEQEFTTKCVLLCKIHHGMFHEDRRSFK
jgi:hypothetical protein